MPNTLGYYLLALCLVFLNSCKDRQSESPDVEHSATSFGEMPRTQAGTFCWPMNYAGVVAGISEDAHVVRLLGSGAYRPNEGDGVRYYINTDQTATLRIATFTDRVVGEIMIEQGYLLVGQTNLG